MRTQMMCLAAAGLVLTLTHGAEAATSGSAEQVAAHAQLVRAEALEVKRLLRERDTDQAILHQRMSVLAEHARSLKASLDVLRGDGGLPPATAAAVERARIATETMHALLKSKLVILAKPAEAAKQRGVLRDKADAVAKRAAHVEREMAQLSN